MAANHMFDELKAAHVAAFFLSRTGDGRLNVLKLIKLMYLAERESYRQHGEPITGDRLVSMPHGPVLSMTLSYVNGDPDPSPNGWDAWIADRSEHMVQLKKAVTDTRNDLDHLSDADLEILAAVWARFGSMGRYELRDWTHTHCPEWQDPQGSSTPISLELLFEALGFDVAQTEELSERARAHGGCRSKLLSAA